jgi:hypothetical protein
MSKTAINKRLTELEAGQPSAASIRDQQRWEASIACMVWDIYDARGQSAEYKGAPPTARQRELSQQFYETDEMIERMETSRQTLEKIYGKAK